MTVHPRNRQFPQLDSDAPEVPLGLQPRYGITYGCGSDKCRDCYEQADEDAKGEKGK